MEGIVLVFHFPHLKYTLQDNTFGVTFFLNCKYSYDKMSTMKINETNQCNKSILLLKFPAWGKTIAIIMTDL